MNHDETPLNPVEPTVPTTEDGVDIFSGDVFQEAPAPTAEEETSPFQEPIWTPRPGDARVTEEAEWSFPIEEKHRNLEKVAIPSETPKNFENFIDRVPNTNVADTELSNWLDELRRGAGYNITYRIKDNAYHEFEPNENQRFTNHFKPQTSPLGILRWNGSWGNSEEEKISGHRAVMRTRTALSMGALHRMDALHSGFSVYVDTPSDAALLRLDNMIKNEKIEVGRVSAGAAFSNMDVFSARAYVAWVEPYIFDTSVRDMKKEDIWDHMSIHDFNLMVWSTACSAYPTGFNYARAVMGKTLEDLRLIEKRINPTKLLWIDSTAFNTFQIKILSKNTASAITKSDVENFKLQSERNVDRLVEITPRVKFELKVPTVREWIHSGSEWLNNMIAMSDKAFGINDSAQLRNAYLQVESLANFLKQYGHWIKAIHVDNSVCDDPETMTKQLEAISQDDVARNTAVEQITRYIRDTTVAIIAVPTVTEQEENVLPRFPHLLPIDPLATFFTLAELRVMKILERAS